MGHGYPAPEAIFDSACRLLRRFAFQLDYDQIHPVVTSVLRQVGRGGTVLRVACLGRKTFLLPVWIDELPFGVGEEHRNRGRMAVHNRLLAWAVMYLQNPYLVILGDYGVMLGINLGRVLGRDDWDKTNAQQDAIKSQMHSHL